MSEQAKLLKAFAANIKSELERLEMSGRELAKRANAHPMTVNECVRGLTMPSAFLILSIAKALGTTVEKLAEEPVKTKPRRAKQTA